MILQLPDAGGMGFLDGSVGSSQDDVQHELLIVCAFKGGRRMSY